MDRPRHDQVDPDDLLEPDRVSPDLPGPGDSEGATPQPEEPVRDEEDLED